MYCPCAIFFVTNAIEYILIGVLWFHRALISGYNCCTVDFIMETGNPKIMDPDSRINKKQALTAVC